MTKDYIATILYILLIIGVIALITTSIDMPLFFHNETISNIEVLANVSPTP
jgi:hypothetical protein